jgi:hypothetical protein
VQFLLEDYYTSNNPLDPKRMVTPVDPTHMVQHFTNTDNREIVLLPYTGQSCLLVGCGITGHIQTNSGGYCFDSKDEEDEYLEEHNHSPLDYYTCDPDIGKGAHTVCFFGETSLTHLPDSSFDKIIFEGIRIYLTDFSVGLITRLLMEEGTVYSNDTLIAWKENGQLCFVATDTEYGGYPNVFDW